MIGRTLIQLLEPLKTKEVIELPINLIYLDLFHYFCEDLL